MKGEEEDGAERNPAGPDWLWPAEKLLHKSTFSFPE